MYNNSHSKLPLFLAMIFIFIIYGCQNRKDLSSAIIKANSEQTPSQSSLDAIVETKAHIEDNNNATVVSHSNDNSKTFNLKIDSKIIINHDKSIFIKVLNLGEEIDTTDLINNISCDIKTKNNSTTRVTPSENSEIIYKQNEKSYRVELNSNINIFDIIEFDCEFDRENKLNKKSAIIKSVIPVFIVSGDIEIKDGDFISHRYKTGEIIYKGNSQFSIKTKDLVSCLGWYANKEWIELSPNENITSTFVNGTTKVFVLDLENAFLGNVKIDKTKITKIQCSIKPIDSISDFANNNNTFTSKIN
jgi:hypothetical protein